ncbi:MAG TPA: Mur ligase family protein, partial [Acidimicrobiales bacterium]|nr:Mur ligase family protein [Acidimicrobiales bacterium]
MDFAEALRWLDQRINLEATASGGRRRPPGLERMTELTALLAEPQRAYPVLHLTGTNGKTSTARILARLLETAGLSVGTYTSPHLESVTERMVWDGRPVSEQGFADAIAAVAAVTPYMEAPPSWFEAVTAAAFHWFADIAVHVAVVEVGLLGRWDATNVADGQVAVITNVGVDHLDYAGSLEGVALEKAGIVKPGSILVTGELDADLEPFFASLPAESVWRWGDDYALLDSTVAHGGRQLSIRTPGGDYDDLFLNLHGAFQGANATIALAAAEAFLGRPLEPPLVAEAFLGVESPGRLEVMGRRPLCLLDGAHNPGGASALAAAIEEE